MKYADKATYNKKNEKQIAEKCDCDKQNKNKF